VGITSYAGHWTNPVWYKEQILDVITQWHNGWNENLEANVDRSWGDIASVVTTSLSYCQSLCIENNLCRAFTFNPATKLCWLKGSRQGWSYAPGATSGSNLAFEVNYNRQGSDYTAFTLTRARPELCLAACGRNPSCVAYTYVSGSPPVCWLKNATPQATYTPGMISGMRRGREPGIDRYGSDFKSTQVSNLWSCEDLCARNASCKAYTFVPSGSGGTCWLKNAVPPATPASGYTSGVKGGVEPRVLRLGNVYSYIDLHAESNVSKRLPEVCQAMCANDSRCLSWRYQVYRDSNNKPSIFKCALMNEVGYAHYTLNDDFVSGIKGAEFFY